MAWLIYFFEEPISIHLGTWFSVGDIQVNYGLLLDSLSMVVMVPVGIVTLSVLIYAIDYMRYDPNRNRFYIILSVFAIFMTVLVISDNYIMMFIGWEFVGVISYLLISFWNTRIAAMKSALSAILLNRMGDTLFVICIGTMLSYFHAVDFETIELITPHTDTYILNLIAIMLLIAATAKSAQLGLHGWLLSAMEGWAKRALFKFHYMREHPNSIWSSLILYASPKVRHPHATRRDYIYIFYMSSEKSKLSLNTLLHVGILKYGQHSGNLIKGSSETLRETFNNVLSFRQGMLGFAGHYQHCLLYSINLNKIYTSYIYNMPTYSGYPHFAGFIINNILQGDTQLKVINNSIHKVGHGASAPNKNIIPIIPHKEIPNFQLGIEHPFFVKNNPYESKDFIYWLIGFTEGDGSFIIKTFKNKNNKYLEFKITQSSNDAQILFYIKKCLGIGTVSKQDKKNNTHHYRVRDKNGLLNIINIFNGNLYLNKSQNKFKEFVKIYNETYKTNIEILEFNKNEPTLDNAWLAGFTDAEGCFTLSYLKNKYVSIRYILSQKNEDLFMNKLALLLEGKTYTLKCGTTNMTVNYLKLIKIIKYINKYSLKTKKLIIYQNWLDVYYSVKNKEHKDPNKIKNILNKIYKKYKI